MEEKEKKEKVPRQPMPEQEPEVRVRNYKEVPFGYSPETAMLEASRCIQCKNPGCMTGCPVEIDIPGFIARIKEGDFAGSIAKIKEKNLLPAVCGRVCPQEVQCEQVCYYPQKLKKGVLIAFIRAIFRFVSPTNTTHGAIVGYWADAKSNEYFIVFPSSIIENI